MLLRQDILTRYLTTFLRHAKLHAASSFVHWSPAAGRIAS